MKLKIFKPAVLLVLGLALGIAAHAQKKHAKPAPKQDLDIDLQFPKLDMKDLDIKLKDLNIQLDKQMKGLDKQLKFDFKDLDKNFTSLSGNLDLRLDSLTSNLNLKFENLGNIALNFDDLAPSIDLGFKDLGKNFSYNYQFNTDDLQQDIQNGDAVEKTKTYSKTYSVDGNDKLEIDNRYGKVTVVTWARNEFKVDVQIKVAANDAGKAQKMLDNVSINDSKNGSTVAFRTNIGDNGSNSWNLWSKGNNVRKMEINYVIYMPTKNPLEITNRYGATEVPDFDGKLVIDCAYGSFSGKALTNNGNAIKVKYGSATIESLNTSDLDVAYGSLDLGAADKLNADVSFGSAKIGKIHTSGNINLRYSGGFQIADVDRNMKNLAINASYSSVKLGLSGDENADFDVTVRYGNFDYGDHDVSITSKTPADGERGFNPTKNFKGHLGKGGGVKTITINASYGSVKFD